MKHRHPARGRVRELVRLALDLARQDVRSRRAGGELVLDRRQRELMLPGRRSRIDVRGLERIHGRSDGREHDPDFLQGSRIAGVHPDQLRRRGRQILVLDAREIRRSG